MSGPVLDQRSPEIKSKVPPDEPKKISSLHSLHYKLAITLYRIFAIAVLYLVLVGIVAYAFIMGFYAINSSWAAPVILSAADEKSLDFREKLVTSQFHQHTGHHRTE